MNHKLNYKIALKGYDHGAEGDNPTDLIFDKLIWRIDDVCSFTSYAKGTIYNLVNRGEIPHCRRGKGKRLVFDSRHVIAWFKGEL